MAERLTIPELQVKFKAFTWDITHALQLRGGNMVRIPRRLDRDAVRIQDPKETIDGYVLMLDVDGRWWSDTNIELSFPPSFEDSILRVVLPLQTFDSIVGKFATQNDTEAYHRWSKLNEIMDTGGSTELFNFSLDELNAYLTQHQRRFANKLLVAMEQTTSKLQ